jgi:hypothetical protein
MTKTEDYTARAAASLAAAEAATTERERLFHRRAHSVWRKLLVGIGEAEERAAMQPPRSEAVYRNPSKPRM